MSKSTLKEHNELRERLCPVQTDINIHADSPKASKQMLKMRHDAHEYQKALDANYKELYEY